MTWTTSFLRFLSLLFLLFLIFSPSYGAVDSHFEGVEDDVVEETIDHDLFKLIDLPFSRIDLPHTPIPNPTSENSKVNMSSDLDSQSLKPQPNQFKPSSPP